MKFLRLNIIQGLLPSLFITFASFTVSAGEANVINVTIESLGDGKFLINTTIAHEDTGWGHYANRWDVLDESGEVIGVRELGHPHVNEQPFTRSLSLAIPSSVKTVSIRANDLVHELGGQVFDVAVPHS